MKSYVVLYLDPAEDRWRRSFVFSRRYFENELSRLRGDLRAAGRADLDRDKKRVYRYRAVPADEAKPKYGLDLF